MNKQIKVNSTGESITFIKTSADTNGEYLEMICTLPAARQGPPKHIHTFQTEFFEATEGKLGLFVGDHNKVLEPGQAYELPANTKHGFYTADNTDIKFRVVYKPALDIEWFMTEIFASMNRANSTKPSIFEASYILSQLNGQFYLAGIPIFAQKIFFSIFSAIGKLFGLVKKVNPKK